MGVKAFSRRQLLGYAGALSAAAALDACGSTPSVPTTAPGGASSGAAAIAPTVAPATGVPPTIAAAATIAANVGAASAAAPSAAPTSAATKAMTPVAGNVDWWTVAGADVGGQMDQEAFIAAFAKSPPGAMITIKPTFLPDDGFSEKLTTVLGTGSGVPDAATFTDPGWFPQAVDLRELIARDGVDITAYSKPHFDSRCRFGDKIIGLPLGVGATMYFYNTDLLGAKGIAAPQWGYATDQFLADATKISDRAKKIFGATMPKAWRGEFFAFGARPFSDDGAKVDGYLNGPKTQKAYEFLYDLATSGAVPTSAEFDVLKTAGTGPIDLFNTGRLGFAGLNNGQFGIVDKAGVKFGLVHNPQGPGEDVITNGWTLPLSIPAASKNREAAWQWVKWATSDAGQRTLMLRNNGYTPNIPALWKDHPAAADPRVQFFFRILGTRQVWEFSGRFPYFDKALRPAQDLYDKIYLGKMKRADIKSELDNLVAPVQKIVDDERAKLMKA